MTMLALMVVVGTGLLASGGGGAEPPSAGRRSPALQERLSWQEFAKNPARVQSLARGVAKMKSRDSAPHESADYRTSWQYWAAMHSYYGPRSQQGGSLQQAITRTPPQFRSFFNGLTDLTPPALPAGVATAVWDQCQHGTPHFFSWHRLYLYYFERVLRDAAGDETLRLPYWDYTNPQQVAFPAAFGSPTENGQPNALFDARRTSQDVQLDPADTDVDASLALTDFTEFQGDIEGGIHGLVHCAMGNGCASSLMGKVPAAAVDPIFWLHHANIDRLWQCWLDEGNRPPGGAWQNKSFAFVDERGAKVTIAVGKLFGSTSILDYTYDHATACERTPAAPTPPIPEPTALAARQPAPPPATVASVSDVRIASALTTVSLPPQPPAGPQAQALASAMSAERPGTMELVLDGVSADAAPGVLFRVYLARKDAPARREYLGTLNFFGLTDHQAHAGGVRRRFTITPRAMRTLAGEKPPNLADYDLVFEASLGRANATADAARAQFNAASGIRIKTISLRVRPAPSR